MSQITTHVLDTNKGKPAWGVAVLLYQQVGIEWIEVSKGITNKEGRLLTLLSEGEFLSRGIYKITFDTRHYYSSQDIDTFYPSVEIIFELKSSEHYHIPLLLSPFGYTTYRGS